MGAHIAGFAGKALRTDQNKLARIIALDPAKQIFAYKDKAGRLDAEDATMVDALITDPEVFGNSFGAQYKVAVYANYGKGSQPNCPLASSKDQELLEYSK